QDGRESRPIGRLHDRWNDPGVWIVTGQAIEILIRAGRVPDRSGDPLNVGDESHFRHVTQHELNIEEAPQIRVGELLIAFVGAKQLVITLDLIAVITDDLPDSIYPQRI